MANSSTKNKGMAKIISSKKSRGIPARAPLPPPAVMACWEAGDQKEYQR
jgi:hypothetical protein